MGGKLDAEVNEYLLLHGTKPGSLFEILSSGLNERISEGIFGDGTYFADDAGKADQYVNEDSAYNDALLALHERLYASPSDHPGHVCYFLVCRVCLGFPVRSNDGKHSMDDSRLIFQNVPGREGRELPYISEQTPPVGHHSLLTPPVRHHSLLAELGPAIKRYREFVVFHGEYIYPEYLLAYQREMQ